MCQQRIDTQFTELQFGLDPEEGCAGIVSSDKMDKTITVKVETNIKHPLYGKGIFLAFWGVSPLDAAEETRRIVDRKNTRICMSPVTPSKK